MLKKKSISPVRASAHLVNVSQMLEKANKNLKAKEEGIFGAVGVNSACSTERKIDNPAEVIQELLAHRGAVVPISKRKKGPEREFRRPTLNPPKIVLQKRKLAAQQQ